jgi:tetratricopeptide (TPR) repeat protein
MTDSNKKIIQFAALFIICAAILFFFMPENIHKNSVAPQPVGQFSDDQLANLHRQIDQLKSSLAANPRNFDLLVRIANIYFDINQFDQAIDYYEQALRLSPDHPHVITDCAIMYFQKGDVDTALAYLDRAIALQPDLAQAYFNKGLILMTARGDAAGALEVWRKFLEISPESEEANFIRQQIRAIQSGEGS